MTEDQLLRQIVQTVSHRGSLSRAVLGIGDDAAALRVQTGRLLLVSTDSLVENVHFSLSYFTAEDLGWKALAVNLSDIAAMGGKPTYALTSLAVPRDLAPEFIKGFYVGLTKLAQRHGVGVIGGDTCSSPLGICINVTIIGEVKRSQMLTRRGASPGDAIFVTGELGRSALGLEILRRPLKSFQGRSALVGSHLRPIPRCSPGRFLATQGIASSMIDTSDGLSTDLGHLCSESGVGASISAERIPMPRLATKTVKRLSHELLEYALHGGEDYELLFTVPKHKRSRVPKRIQGVPVHEIGYITASARKCWIVQGAVRKRLVSGGFDHFSGQGLR